jgi:hypothetical protein
MKMKIPFLHCALSIFLVSLPFTFVNAEQESKPSAHNQEDLQAEVEKLRAKLSALEKAQTDNTVDTHEILNNRIEQLDKKLEKQNNKVKFDGFISAGFSITDEDNGLRLEPFGFSDEPDWESDSVVGVQSTIKINREMKAVLQMVANGWDNWEPQIAWAFLNYQFNADYRMRVGRMRLPLYLFSDSMDIGYTYPWVRPPIELYSARGAENIDGVDFSYDFQTSNFNHRITAVIGRTTDFRLNNESRLIEAAIGEDIYGVNIRSNKGSFSSFLGVHTVELNIKTAAGPYDESYIYYIGGINFDNGIWLVTAESALRYTVDTELSPTNDQFELTVGRRYNKFLPYFMYGREYIKGEVASLNPLEEDYRSYSVGLRYELDYGIALKTELNHYVIGKAGFPFENTDAYQSGQSLTEINILTFLVDALF